MLVKLFVYGTLKVGGVLHTRVEESSEVDTVKEATMYSLGMYPAVRLEGEGTVHGEIHTIDDKYLPAYDRIEGEGVLYERVPIVTEGGVEVQIYVFMQRLPESLLITNGVWEITK